MISYQRFPEQTTNIDQCPASLLASASYNRIGRKPLLLAGSVGMTLTVGARAAVFVTAGVGPDGKPVLSQMGALAGLVTANLYIVAFAVLWGPVMWVLLGEMFPNEIRGAAVAMSGATNWAANFTVTVTFLTDHYGPGNANRAKKSRNYAQAKIKTVRVAAYAPGLNCRYTP